MTLLLAWPLRARAVPRRQEEALETISSLGAVAGALLRVPDALEWQRLSYALLGQRAPASVVHHLAPQAALCTPRLAGWLVLAGAVGAQEAAGAWGRPEVLEAVVARAGGGHGGQGEPGVRGDEAVLWAGLGVALLHVAGEAEDLQELRGLADACLRHQQLPGVRWAMPYLQLSELVGVVAQFVEVGRAHVRSQQQAAAQRAAARQRAQQAAQEELRAALQQGGGAGVEWGEGEGEEAEEGEAEEGAEESAGSGQGAGGVVSDGGECSWEGEEGEEGEQEGEQAQEEPAAEAAASGSQGSIAQGPAEGQVSAEGLSPEPAESEMAGDSVSDGGQEQDS